MPTVQRPTLDLTRPMYLIGFWQERDSVGFYMLSGFRQPYYNYREAVNAAAKIAASDDSRGKQLFIFEVASKIDLAVPQPPIKITSLPIADEDAR